MGLGHPRYLGVSEVYNSAGPGHFLTFSIVTIMRDGSFQVSKLYLHERD